MVYLVVGSAACCIAGWEKALAELGFGPARYPPWPHTIPVTIFLLIYILAGVMALAVSIMLAFHLRSVVAGETTVEGQDNEIYARIAKDRGEMFVNSYDLGGWANLALFFNIVLGKRTLSPPTPHALYTLLLPMRVQPYTDGYSWARRAGYERGHGGVRRGDELTDEEDPEDAHRRATWGGTFIWMIFELAVCTRGGGDGG
uniref:Protein S-acyltransferase n=1 Tax=Mycena chlorophos TaxID=658473 RepID=A0ABQ0L5G4_MYCCL|nr:predicted protein [Mycena chlorophos]